MAKKLVYNYTFNPGAAGVGNLVIHGYYPLKTLLLITNVTDSQIIFSFADPTYAGSVDYSDATDETTIIFNYDTSSMDASDQIQIFVDEQETKIDFSETFVDPVSKLRVSNPQNLIDTDFEYGLQPTKWETIELVNNIPSFYSKDSQYSIEDVTTVEAIDRDATITVITSTPHGLSVGVPIDVQGLTSPTAEGKFLITSVPSTTSFTYVAKDNQVLGEGIFNLNTSYTTIRTGEFFIGSDVKFKQDDGLISDNRPNSTINVTTDYVHGFTPGSNFYVTNTVGSKQYRLEYVTNDIASDGRPNVDFDDIIESSGTIDSSLTETKKMTGTYALKFDVNSVDTADNSITWPNHRLRPGDALLYVPPSGDTEIGGLQRFQLYYVKQALTADKITLCDISTSTTVAVNPEISFTSTGTSNFGRHQLILAYEYYYIRTRYRSYIRLTPRHSGFGSGSGWDRRSSSEYYPHGLSGRKAQRCKFVFANGYTLNNSWTDNRSVYATNRNANYTLGKSGTTPDGYDFIEDFSRFNLPHPDNAAVTTSEPNYSWDDDYRYFDRYVSYSLRDDIAGLGRIFTVDLDFDTEADSLYVPNHGISVGFGATAYFEKTGGGNAVTRTEVVNTESVVPQYASYSGDFSATVTAISPDRLRVEELNRLQQWNGSYNLTLYKDNEVRDTFFIPGINGLSSNETLLVETTGTATLPTGSSGPIEPEKSTIQAVYNATTRGLDTIRETLATNNAATLLAYNNSQEHYPFINSDITVDGGVQRLGWRRTRLTIGGYYAEGTGQTAQIWSQVSKNFATLTGWANGKAFDPFDTTSRAGEGWYMCITPFTGQNTTIPYFVSVKQVPKYSETNPSVGANGFFWSDRPVEDFPPTPNLLPNPNNNNAEANWFDVTGSQAGLGWKYTYEARYYETNSSRHGYIFLQITMSNNTWPQYKPQNTAFNITASSPFESLGNISGQRYIICTVIPIKNNTNNTFFGISGTLYNFQELAEVITNEIAESLENPTLTVGINTVKSKIVGNARLALQTVDGLPYNLSGFGTASPGGSIIFSTEEKTGGVDGYYQAYSVDNNSFKLGTNTGISQKVVEWDYQSVNPLYITSINHKIPDNQRVVYEEISGGILGLTSNTEYYIDVTGPDTFGFKESINGDRITMGSTLSGSFQLTTNSISGISSIPGTVAISTSSKVVEGTDTDFTRYFKVGDDFIVENTDVTPTEYVNLTVDSVVDGTNLTIRESPGITNASTKAFVTTKINVRPDGTNVHRPFDGGVEITAGSSPDSNIVRQTRKYFRYQSGKGIQCSLAINFNPPRQIVSMFGQTGGTLSDNLDWEVNIRNRDSSAFILFGEDRNGNVLSDNAKITVYDIDTLTLNVGSPGHPVWIKSAPGTGVGDAIPQAYVTNNGTSDGTIVFDTTTVGVGTYYYQCENHSSMYGEIEVLPTPSAGPTGTLVKFSTLTPHGLLKGNDVKIRGAGDSAYDGSYEIVAVNNEDAYYISSTTSATSIVASPALEYNITEWSNSAVRCGLFDFQNGFFFEYDGSTLYAVRRSSTFQLPLRADVTYNSHLVNWASGAKFTNKVNVNDYIVIRGTSYKVTSVTDDQLNVQPAYRGVSDVGITITKTVDTKVAQENWNIDKADGTGPSGFRLDKTKIQMTYLDYSWYGAGKIRFGFKDTYGHVKYFHEFIHNNILDEAYMRSGNIPGRYEITNVNGVVPSYIPSLFHWGTSVMMDGGFDDDKAYQFTATSNTLVFTNGDGETALTTANSTSYYVFRNGGRSYYLRLFVAPANLTKFNNGTPLYTDGSTSDILDGETVFRTGYLGSNGFVDIFIGETSGSQSLDIIPSIPSNTTIYIGSPPSGGNATELGPDTEIPVISIRLAPSVDNNLTGPVGSRDIINRMQLQLKSLGITLTHDCNVDLILNGSINNKDFSAVDTPSLSELIVHSGVDQIKSGTKVFSFRASGGSEDATGARLGSTSDFDLSTVTDLGNSILGGDDIFPNGPDLLTIAISPIDTSGINATAPLKVSARITWTESQA